jgi:thiol-disulfide isomerase/thioredoxin
LGNSILAASFVLIILAACTAAPHASPPLSRNVAALQAEESGALGEPALVEFYTTDCLSCRAIRAEMGVLDQRYEGKVKFIYLDADLPESQPYLGRYNVRGVPTLALLDRGGRVVSSLPGWPGEPAMTAALNTLAAQPR